MNIYLFIIIIIIVGQHLLDLVIENLNINVASSILPQEFEGYFSAEKYSQSQNYLKEKTSFRLIKETIFTSIILVFILMGGFNSVDTFARSFNLSPIFTALIFAAILMLAVQILNIPFSCYHTFVIEAKYGFNKTTLKTFILDIVKTWLLGALIGAAAYATVVWFFRTMGQFAWLYCWVGIALFQLFLIFIAPVVIMPLFNKFVPLENGALKQAIQNYAAKEKFQIKGIFKIDASRRSTKSNAFFTGFGKYRRIALFDTLIAKHSVDELVCVLAHEIGHYKKKHILKSILISVVTSGLLFFILSLFINNPGLFAAFKMQHLSVYASLFFFTFLYAPINMLLSIAGNILSRKYEYEADKFAVSTYKKPEALIDALKKLSVDNLSNLTPHPLKVFFDYSHPPVLKRIEAIRKIAVK